MNTDEMLAALVAGQRQTAAAITQINARLDRIEGVTHSPQEIPAPTTTEVHMDTQHAQVAKATITKERNRREHNRALPKGSPDRKRAGGGVLAVLGQLDKHQLAAIERGESVEHVSKTRTWVITLKG
jgi:hypothetical protein